MVLSRVFDIETARKELTKGLVLTLAVGEHAPQIVEQLGKELRRYPGRLSGLHPGAGRDRPAGGAAGRRAIPGQPGGRGRRPAGNAVGAGAGLIQGK